MSLSPDLLATLLILASAFFHASWNAILKSGSDRAAMIGILNVGAALMSLPLLAFVPAPGPAELKWIGVSIVIHLMYQLSLARMMAGADYSLVYPISRGLGPLVVTSVSVAFLAEPLSALQIGAILVLVAGAGLAGFTAAPGAFHRPPLTAIGWAVFVGLLIGSYTLVDGSAVKRMSPLTFILWSNIFIMPPMMLVLFQQHGPKFTARMKAVWRRGIAMTVVAYTGYTMALYAFSLGGLAQIAALRETSILFAAFIGALALKERLTLLRIAGILLIAFGAVALKLL